MQTRLHASSLKRLRYAPGPVLLALAALALAAPAQAGSITVNNTDCTLINAVNAANNANGVAPIDSIGVGSCTGATAGGNTITLTADVDFVEPSIKDPTQGNKSTYALPAIQSAIVIEGKGYTLRNTKNGTKKEFDFAVLTQAGASLTVRDLTFTGGNASFGAIYCTAGTLNVTRSLFLKNETLSGTGALWLSDACNASISNTSFIGNKSVGNVTATGVVYAASTTGQIELNHITATGNTTNANAGFLEPPRLSRRLQTLRG